MIDRLTGSSESDADDGAGLGLPFPKDDLLLELRKHELMIADEESVRHVSQLLRVVGLELERRGLVICGKERRGGWGGEGEEKGRRRGTGMMGRKGGKGRMGRRRGSVRKKSDEKGTNRRGGR